MKQHVWRCWLWIGTKPTEIGPKMLWITSFFVVSQVLLKCLDHRRLRGRCIHWETQDRPEDWFISWGALDEGPPPIQPRFPGLLSQKETPQQSEILREMFRFSHRFWREIWVKFSLAHPNPGKRSTENCTKISRKIKNGEKIHFRTSAG